MVKNLHAHTQKKGKKNTHLLDITNANEACVCACAEFAVC